MKPMKKCTIRLVAWQVKTIGRLAKREKVSWSEELRRLLDWQLEILGWLQPRKRRKK